MDDEEEHSITKLSPMRSGSRSDSEQLLCAAAFALMDSPKEDIETLIVGFRQLSDKEYTRLS